MAGAAAGDAGCGRRRRANSSLFLPPEQRPWAGHLPLWASPGRQDDDACPGWVTGCFWQSGPSHPARLPPGSSVLFCTWSRPSAPRCQRPCLPSRPRTVARRELRHLSLPPSRYLGAFSVPGPVRDNVGDMRGPPSWGSQSSDSSVWARLRWGSPGEGA